MDNNLPSFLANSEDRIYAGISCKRNKLPFVDRTLKNIAGFIITSYIQSETARKNGILQNIAAWAKVIFLLGFIVVVSVTGNAKQQLFYSAFFLILYIFSGIRIFKVFKRIFFIGFVFGFLIMLPAALNIITPGKFMVTLVTFKSETVFWIYTIPKTIGVTYEGATIVLKFWLKVSNSIALTFLIAYTTQFVEIIKSLKLFKVPDLLLLTITLTHKYLFVLAQTTEEAYFALKARWWKKQKTSENSKIIAGRISYIFRRSWFKYEEIYMAMVARGYNGTVKLSYSKKISVLDIVFLILATFVAITGFYI